MTCYDVVRSFNLVYKPSLSDKNVTTFQKDDVVVELYRGEEWYFSSDKKTDDGVGSSGLKEVLKSLS